MVLISPYQIDIDLEVKSYKFNRLHTIDVDLYVYKNDVELTRQLSVNSAYKQNRIVMKISWLSNNWCQIDIDLTSMYGLKWFCEIYIL